MSHTVIIGAGHNGLTAAAILAAAGRKVTVLEKRESPGGLCAGAEFHPGFRHTGILHSSHRVRRSLVDPLRLPLTWQAPPSRFIAGTAGLGRPLRGDDAGWAEFDAFLSRIRPLVTAIVDAPPPNVGQDGRLWPLVQSALRFRKLSAADRATVLRIGPTCVEDFLSEHFTDPAVRAGLAMDALWGTWMAPRSPTSTAPLLLNASMAGEEVAGGPAALVEALLATCKQAGVTVRCGAPVSRITLANNAVTGVILEDGEEIAAAEVLSTVGPRQTILELIHPAELLPKLEAEARRIRTRGILAKVHLALSSPLVTGGEPREHLQIGASPVDIERAFDHAKHRRLAARPVLDIRQPTLSTPSLAPDGQHVASILVYGAPIDRDGGWDDAGREELLATVLQTLTAACPGADSTVLGAEVLTPADLAEEFGLEGGHLWHGELGLDQVWVFRPTPSLTRYCSPIGGLWLGGAGCHPGGGVTCGPGALAAAAMLR